MTTLNVELSEALRSSLVGSNNGVWVYAIYFDSAGVAHTTELIDNGSAVTQAPAEAGDATVTDGNAAIPLPDSFVGGKVYLLVQSQDSSNPNDLATLIDEQSKINWQNADDWDFRYDSFEVTLDNSANDVGNLTSVNGFGLPMELSVTYSDGTTSTRGYNVTGTQLLNDLEATSSQTVVDTYSSGALQGDPRMAISPTEAVGANPPDPAFSSSDWDAYIASLQTADTGIAITGFFNGAPDANHVWHNGGFFSYTLEWDAAEETFWLSPGASSQIQGFIRITPADLADSIYSTLGDVGIYTNQDDAEPYRILDNTAFATGEYSMNTGENNQWGNVLTQFLTGFTAGFYGTEGQSLNGLVSAPIDLNQNWNWDPSYAFGQNLAGDAAIFQDPYSEVFYFNSNSYGSGYSDNLMKQYTEGGPLIPVSNPAGAPDAGANVTDINLTIFADDETPTGYEQTRIDNYIAPDPSGYEVPDATSGANIKLSFTNSGMVLDENTTITFGIFGGLDGGGVPIFHEVTLQAPAGQSPWQIWQLAVTDGVWSATLVDGDQGTGNLLLTGFPTAGNGGIYWNQITVGDKTFNLYTTMAADGQHFLNPAFEGQSDSLAVDGLATLAPQFSTEDEIITFTVNFLPSSTATVDPDLLVFDPSALPAAAAPDAPVAGLLNDGVFDPLAGQVNKEANAASTDQAEVAFGWTGLNDAPGTNGDGGWIQSATNKTGAQHTAEINLSLSGAPVVPPIVTQADIDGQWQTEARALSNGSYTVTMQEYVSDGSGGQIAVGAESQILSLDVTLSDLALGASGEGDALELAVGGGSDPGGNWIHLEMVDSTVASGTSLLLYATDAAGLLVDRESGLADAGVTLDEAIQGTIGAVHADSGTRLLLGEQSVFLRTGQELHFAVVSGAGVIDTNPDVTITDSGGGALDVAIGGFSLSVETDNTLSAEALMGEAQRLSNDALLYLQHGSTLNLDLVGSCGNTNTLAFVRMDVDLATGALSVDGVDYGDTLAFKDAVADNLDSGFEYRRGGHFSDSQSWTVAGDTGFYAPVLLTQRGEVFVIGDGNSGGHEYIRMYGENTFGFEDLSAAQGSDFDYNDMVMRIMADTDPGSLAEGWMV
jgi:hypothetical protein